MLGCLLLLPLALSQAELQLLHADRATSESLATDGIQILLGLTLADGSKGRWAKPSRVCSLINISSPMTGDFGWSWQLARRGVQAMLTCTDGDPVPTPTPLSGNATSPTASPTRAPVAHPYKLQVSIGPVSDYRTFTGETLSVSVRDGSIHGVNGTASNNVSFVVDGAGDWLPYRDINDRLLFAAVLASGLGWLTSASLAGMHATLARQAALAALKCGGGAATSSSAGLTWGQHLLWVDFGGSGGTGMLLACCICSAAMCICVPLVHSVLSLACKRARCVRAQGSAIANKGSKGSLSTQQELGLLLRQHHPYADQGKLDMHAGDLASAQRGGYQSMASVVNAHYDQGDEAAGGKETAGSSGDESDADVPGNEAATARECRTVSHFNTSVLPPLLLVAPAALHSGMRLATRGDSAGAAAIGIGAAMSVAMIVLWAAGAMRAPVEGHRGQAPELEHNLFAWKEAKLSGAKYVQIRKYLWGRGIWQGSTQTGQMYLMRWWHSFAAYRERCRLFLIGEIVAVLVVAVATADESPSAYDTCAMVSFVSAGPSALLAAAMCLLSPHGSGVDDIALVLINFMHVIAAVLVGVAWQNRAAVSVNFDWAAVMLMITAIAILVKLLIDLLIWCLRPLYGQPRTHDEVAMLEHVQEVLRELDLETQEKREEEAQKAADLARAVAAAAVQCEQELIDFLDAQNMPEMVVPLVEQCGVRNIRDLLGIDADFADGIHPRLPLVLDEAHRLYGSAATPQSSPTALGRRKQSRPSPRSPRHRKPPTPVAKGVPIVDQDQCEQPPDLTAPLQAPRRPQGRRHREEREGQRPSAELHRRPRRSRYPANVSPSTPTLSEVSAPSAPLTPLSPRRTFVSDAPTHTHTQRRATVVAPGDSPPDGTLEARSSLSALALLAPHTAGGVGRTPSTKASKLLASIPPKKRRRQSARDDSATLAELQPVSHDRRGSAPTHLSHTEPAHSTRIVELVQEARSHDLAPSLTPPMLPETSTSDTSVESLRMLTMSRRDSEHGTTVSVLETSTIEDFPRLVTSGLPRHSTTSTHGGSRLRHATALTALAPSRRGGVPKAASAIRAQPPDARPYLAATPRAVSVPPEQRPGLGAGTVLAAMLESPKKPPERPSRTFDSGPDAWQYLTAAVPDLGSTVASVAFSSAGSDLEAVEMLAAPLGDPPRRRKDRISAPDARALFAAVMPQPATQHSADYPEPRGADAREVLAAAAPPVGNSRPGPAPDALPFLAATGVRLEPRDDTNSRRASDATGLLAGAATEWSRAAGSNPARRPSDARELLAAAAPSHADDSRPDAAAAVAALLPPI